MNSRKAPPALPPYEALHRPIQPADIQVRGYLTVVVFGPGTGEAILVHLPDGSVGVVDACGQQGDNKAKGGDPVMELLEAMGVQQLEFVCLTHAHADHFRGLCDLLKAYRKRNRGIKHLWWGGERERRFERKWLQVLKKDQERGRGQDQGREVPRKDEVDELHCVVQQIGWYLGKDTHTQAVSDSKRLAHLGEHDTKVKVQGLGPTTDDLHEAWKKHAGSAALDEHLFDPNRVSTALLLQWKKTRVLLGGDQLVGVAPNRGWKAAAPHIPPRMTLVKVPHHGSRGAYDPDLWKRMRPRLAVVTPYQSAAGRQPPQPDMIHTLGSITPTVITSRPRWLSENSRLAVVPNNQRVPNRLLPDPVLAAHDHRPAPGAAGGKNCVLVRMDEKGQVVHVGLYGEAAFYRPRSKG